MLLLVTVVREKCKKETETGETIGFFCHIFVIGEISIGEEARLAKLMPQLRKTKKVFANFPRAEDRAIFEDLRLQGQGLGQELEASRPRPRTSKCVLEDVLEAKDVRVDSTSG